jgi:hypothetical protein
MFDLLVVSSAPSVYRRKWDLNAKLESSLSHFIFNTLSSRRFQRGFDRVNLHHPALDWRRASMHAARDLGRGSAAMRLRVTLVYRRKLKLKA